MTARFLVGDVFERLGELPDGSVDLILFSPPFLALRSYLPDDHPDKHLEIGAETSPGAFIDTLLRLVEALAPKLSRTGSMCIELGDTYAGSGGAGGDYYNEDGLRAGQNKPDGAAKRARFDGRDSSYGTGTAPRPARTRKGRDRAGVTQVPRIRQGATDRGAEGGLVYRGGGRQPEKLGDDWPEAKSLCLIPELFRVALVYGFNPLTGRQTPRWRARNVIRWCRPNPPVGALADKVRPATSDMVVICQATDRYFDLDAVRTPLTEPGAVKTHLTAQHNPSLGWDTNSAEIRQNPAGSPPLDHWWHDDVFDQDAWLISTRPFAGAHYATWPEALLTKPIEAMCPREVCRTCGEPRRRITEPDPGAPTRTISPVTEQSERERINLDQANRPNKQEPRDRAGERPVDRSVVTVGWTDCGHDDYRTGVVLDPFAGSGTTLAVAVGHGRDAVGIDLDARNLDLARERVGMFLEWDDPPRPVEDTVIL